jgi:YidC/Oxa1 family membrane protein insertase
MNRLYPPKPISKGTNSLAQAGQQTSGATNATKAHLAPAVPTFTAAPTTTFVRPGATEELLVLENDNARYTFSSHGGGMKLVELKRYAAVVGKERRKNPAGPNLASLNQQAPMPVLALLGSEAVQGDGLCKLTRTPAGARAEKQLTNGLRVVKEFRLSTNYLMEAAVRLENHGPDALTIPLQEWNVGTATPMGPHDANIAMMGLIEYNGSKAEYIGDSWFANRTLGCLPGVSRAEYVSGTNVVWAAVHNQFFTLAVIPQSAAPRLIARRIDLPRPSVSVLADNAKAMAPPVGFQGSMIYPELTLGTNQAVERRFLVYAGPKEYNLLARLGTQMGNNLDLIMDYGGFFGFFAKLLLLSMNGLNAFGLGYGLAIIVITIVIKLLFWPLTNASTKSMKRMAALQPQMKAIQEKYKDDPKKMNANLMKFMKEQKVSPMSGCFPMLLQIPVFFGFYKMLQSAIELRGARFLWAFDLSGPDTVYVIGWLNRLNFWPVTWLHDFPVNPIPLIMGATMVWQARMTPPSPGMDPAQQKIMKYMPLMFMVFLYNFSAGLTLYWTVQNLLTIAQMKLTKNGSAVSQPPRKSGWPVSGAFGLRRNKP